MKAVLDKATELAGRALPGREIALLTAEEGELSVVRSSGLGPGARRLIQSWARSNAALLGEPREIGELGDNQDLERLALRLGVGELHSHPLAFQGRRYGVIVTLAQAVEPFTSIERKTVAEFAEQLAVALRNARLFQQLVERANHDSLTGLANRREFDRVLERELERSSRYGEIFTVAMIDLDGFKGLNDERGHAAGDALLRQAAEVIDDACRSSDVAARFGGDEFVLLMPETDQFAAAALCERLRTEVETLADVSLSWGVAEYPTHGLGALDLMRAADAAMYASKPKVVGAERTADVEA